MSLFLNSKHMTNSQYPVMTLNEKFVKEFRQQQGNFLGLTYLGVGSKIKGTLVLQFQEQPKTEALQDGFCFFHKLVRIKKKSFLMGGIQINQGIFHSFLPLEHPLIRLVLHTFIETREFFFLIFHEDNSLSVHQLFLTSRETDDLGKKLRSIQQDMSLLRKESPLLFRSHEKELPTPMKLICAKDLDHLNLKDPRVSLKHHKRVLRLLT